jgi:hypothetical protein
MTELTGSVPMTFTHVRSWRIVGGIGMPVDTDCMKLASGGNWSYTLVKAIDDSFEKCDQGMALGHLALQGIFGPAKVGTLEDRLASEVEEIRLARSKKIGGSPLLLFVGSGEIDVSVSEPAQQREDYILTFDAFDKESIRRQFAHQHRSMQLALALESKSRVRFDQVATGVYCTNTDGHTIHSLSFAMNADLSVASAMSQDGADAITRRFALLNKSSQLESTVRLFADMSTYGREPFRVFISGWTAFEILIKKTFKDYEKKFFGDVQIPHQRELADQFLSRIRESMVKNINVIDQFLVVSSVLLPAQDSDVAKNDLFVFKRIKKVRDDIAHGSAFDESLLPIVELSDLLMKYLAAHANQSINLLPNSTGILVSDLPFKGLKHV